MAALREIIPFILNELINSSESSDEELNILCLGSERAGASTLWSGEQRPRITHYVERTVAIYSSWEFKSHFRLERETFQYVLGLIAPTINSGAVAVAGRPRISPETQLLIALWTMATPDSYRSVCDRFDVGRATAVRAVRRVAAALFQLAPAIIKWPSGNRLSEVTDGFKKTKNFPDIIGAIDGTFIKIPAPTVHPESYVNRKGDHAVVLQAVCDFEGIFTHAYAGEVGSVHDARIFRKSELLGYVLEESLIRFPHNTHLIGDPAYENVNHLLVAYRNNGHLSEQQKNFNYCLSSTRTIIERSFAFLKGRFRSLKYLDMRRIDLIPNYIIACCVLHNICHSRHDFINEEELQFEDDNESLPELDDGMIGNNFTITKALGSAKRLQITNNLPMVMPRR